MRYRLMATYRGVPYEVGIGPTDGDVVLFAACPPPEELGFEPATGHWRKRVRIQDVQGLWESRPMGTFRGERCIVLDDLGDRLHIAYQGHDAYQAEQLGYWQVDRGVFELVAPREEVTDIVEERLDYARRAAPAPDGGAYAGPDSGAFTAPDGGAHTAPAAGAHTAPAAGAHTAPAAGAHAAPAAGAHAAPAGGAHAAPDGGAYTAPDAGPYGAPDGGAHAAPGGYPSAGFLPRRADRSDPQRDLAVIPPTSEPPLPLEAAALRAASARAQQAPRPAAFAPPAHPPAPSASAPYAPAPAGPDAPDAPASTRRRRSALRRLATQRIFSELAGLAAIPPSAYAVGEEVDGAMCLIQTPEGFEVFNAAGGSRHEVRLFDDEESAYFYLFGVLAAEAVRTGRLAPKD